MLCALPGMAGHLKNTQWHSRVSPRFVSWHWSCCHTPPGTFYRARVCVQSLASLAACPQTLPPEHTLIHPLSDPQPPPPFNSLIAQGHGGL